MYYSRRVACFEDVESASEVEDSGVAVSSLSKEDLNRSFVRMQRRSEKYKAKFVQVMQAYKDVDRERDKLRVSLHTTHDDVNTGSSG